LPVFIAGASACAEIKQTTRDISVENFTSRFMFELIQATLPTPVTKRFPLLARHFMQGFPLPEERFI
jgi:hypothetical protein